MAQVLPDHQADGGVRPNTHPLRREAFVDPEHTLGFHRLGGTVNQPAVFEACAAWCDVALVRLYCPGVLETNQLCLCYCAPEVCLSIPRTGGARKKRACQEEKRQQSRHGEEQNGRGKECVRAHVCETKCEKQQKDEEEERRTFAAWVGGLVHEACADCIDRARCHGNGKPCNSP